VRAGRQAHSRRCSAQDGRQGQHQALGRASPSPISAPRPTDSSSPEPRRPCAARSQLRLRGSRPGPPSCPSPGQWGRPRATGPRPGCISFISCPEPTSSSAPCPVVSRPGSKNTSRWDARGTRPQLLGPQGGRTWVTVRPGVWGLAWTWGASEGGRGRVPILGGPPRTGVGDQNPRYLTKGKGAGSPSPEGERWGRQDSLL
jgi:hypothetical protein